MSSGTVSDDGLGGLLGVNFRGFAFGGGGLAAAGGKGEHHAEREDECKNPSHFVLPLFFNFAWGFAGECWGFGGPGKEKALSQAV